MIKTQLKGILSSVLCLCFAMTGTAMAGQLVPLKTTQGSSSELVLTVQSPQGQGSGAQVWVETRDGKLLFEGKTVDQNGLGVFKAATTADHLRDSITITVYKEGFEIVSLRDNTASDVKISLNQAVTDSYNTLKGTLKGFTPPTSKDYVQLGLVAKALRVADLAQLDPSNFISPWKDTIDVFGKRELPSNIVLPQQTVSILFMSIDLNKPEYRLPVVKGGSDRYFGVTAQAVAQDLVDAIRKKVPAYELLDLLEFKTVGHSNRMNTPRVDSDLPLDVNANTALLDPITLQPSPKRNAPSDAKHLAVALSEVEPGVYVANDIKQVKNSNVTLMRAGSSTRVMDLWTLGGDHIRGSWLPKGVTNLPEVSFNTVLSVPSLNDRWDVTVPTTANMVVGRVEKRFKTSLGSNKMISLWTVYTSGQTELKLPIYALSQLKGQLADASTFSVDLLEVGAGGYPFIDGDLAEQKLQVFEKVRSKLGR